MNLLPCGAYSLHRFDHAQDDLVEKKMPTISDIHDNVTTLIMVITTMVMIKMMLSIYTYVCVVQLDGGAQHDHICAVEEHPNYPVTEENGNGDDIPSYSL